MDLSFMALYKSQLSQLASLSPQCNVGFGSVHTLDERARVNMGEKGSKEDKHKRQSETLIYGPSKSCFGALD